MRLLKDMQSEGLTLKQNVLGRVFDPSDPNQVRNAFQSKNHFVFVCWVPEILITENWKQNKDDIVLMGSLTANYRFLTFIILSDT